MLNLDVMSSLPRALLFTAGAYLGYCIFVAENEKFISVFLGLSENQMLQGTTLVNSAAD